jgi:hypothetical protein
MLMNDLYWHFGRGFTGSELPTCVLISSHAVVSTSIQLQFADMHYENGAVTACQNVPPGMPCS